MLASLVAALPQAAAVAPTPPPATQVASEDIEVLGKREERRIRTVVRRLIDPLGYNGVGRFEKPVCPGVVGMRTRGAIQLIDGIRANARAAGAPLAVDGCDVSALVIFTDDPRGVTNRMLDRMYLARYMPIHNVRELRESDAPIRSWRIQAPEGADGSAAIIEPGEAPLTRGVYSSRLTSNSRIATALSVVVIDTRAAAGKSMRQLSDVSTIHLLLPLAQETPASDVDSILRLFATASPAPALTSLDRGMLRGLYAPGANNVGRSEQAGQMAREVRMIRAGNGRDESDRTPSLP